MYHFWTRITRTRRDRTTSRTHFNQGTGTVRKGVAIAASLALAMAIVAVPAFNFETSTPAFGAPGNPGVPAAPLDVFKETFGDGTGTSTPMSLRVYPPSGSPVYTASEAWLPRASSSVMEPSERKGRCNGWILNSKTQNPGIQADYGCDPSAGVKMWPQLQAMASALGTFQGMGAGAETNNVLSSASNSVAADQYAQDPGTLIRTNSATTANGGRFFAVSAVFAALNCAKLDSSSGGWVDPQESFYLIFNGTRQLLTPTPLNPCATGTSSTITEYHPSFPGVVTGTHTVYMDRLSSNAFLLGTPAETFQLGFELYNATATGKGNDVAFDSLAIIDVTPQLDQAFTPAVVPIGVSSNWVFTITNTTDLQAKAGWAYTVPIPAGLTVGTATTNTCSATIAASTSLTITNGTLAKGATSCQIIIPVTPTLNDTYTSQASSITNLGVNPPANTTLKTTELTLDVSVNPTALTAANQTATFSFEVTNTGVVEVKDLQVTAPTTLASGTLGAISCPVTILAAGATTTCTATYTSAQGDITRTYVDVTGKATAKADEATVRTESETDTARVSVLGTSSISITASDPGSMTTVGEVKTFTFTVENTGQTTLDTVQILIDDFDGTGTPPVFTCVSTSLAPGASTTCSGTYIVTALDIASKLITLDAVATSKNAGGDDVVSDQAREQVPYAKGTPDPTKSSLAVSHTNRVVGEPDVATATIVDANNVPLDGITVTFALTGSGTFGSADATRVPTATCVTNTQGQCSVTFTDPKAEVCDVSATVVVAGTPTQITNSPISVTFTAGPFSYATSEFTVTPIATVGNPATYLVVSDGSVYYTGKLTPKDQYGNIITGLNQADVEFLASSTDVTEANFTPNPDGTFTVQYSSKLADSAPTASVTYQGLPVGTTKPIPFKAGDPDPDPNVEVDCPAGAVGTNMSVSPARVMVPGSSTVTVYVTDQFCNPVEDAVVDLYLVPGSSAQLGSSQVTTGSTGHASTTVSDTAPEIVRINGSVTNGPLAGPIQNSPVSVEFYDGDEPAAPVITGPGDGDVTNDNTPEITGTGDEPGNEITVTDEDGDVLCTAVVQEDLSWSCTSTKELEDGDHTITATEKDPVGNESEPSNEVTFTIDTTAPNPPVITGPEDGDVTNDNTPEITGTGDEPGNTITVTDEDGDVLCTAVVQEDLSWSCTSTKELEDGDHTITATEKDPVGNESEPSNEVTFTVDTTAPNPPVITGPEDGDVTNDNTPEITGTGDEPGNMITVTDEDGDVLCTAVVQKDLSWSCTSTKELEDGDHTITATETDPAGNESEPSNEVTFTVDTTAPRPPIITVPTDGATVLTNKPPIKGIGDEPGNTITVTENGKTICTATVLADTTWSCIPVAGLTDGEHTIVAIETDPAGNVSDPSNEVTFTVDSSAPNPPVITGPEDGDVVTTPTPEITGTGDEPGNEITVTDEDGDVLCTAIVQPDKSWSCTPTKELEDGDHSITAIEKDPLGNESAPSEEVTFTVDTTAPNPPVITGPEDGDVVSDNTPEITGTGDEPGNTITVTDEDGDVLCTAVVQEDLSWSCTSTKELEDGDHTITATEKDPVGNESEPSNEVTFTIDTTAPNPPVITGPEDGDVVTTPTPEITGTGDEPGNEITVTDEDGDVLCTAIVQPDKSWSCTPTKELEDGDHTISATETDPNGNESGESNIVTFTVDTTVPNPPIITGPEQGETVPTDTPKITGTGDEPGNEITVTEDGEVLCTAIVQEDLSWSCTPSKPLEDGDHTITATETDPEGNESEPSEEVTFTVDTMAPNPPVITGPEDGSTTDDNTPLITGTGDEPGNTITVYENNTVICTATVRTDKTWECTPVAPMADGDHTIVATETDPVGNVSENSNEVTFTIDTTAPNPPVITGPEDGSTVQTNKPPIIGTGDEPGNTVTVTEDGTTICTAIVKEDKTWSCIPDDGLTEGGHTIIAHETDPAGNISDPSNQVSFTVDSDAPNPPVITGPKDGELTNDDTPETTGTGDEPGNEITVTEDGEVLCTAIVQEDLSWSCTPSKPLEDGEHTITATETDPTGSESAPSDEVTFTVDTTPPNPPVITGPEDGSVTTDRTPLIEGTGDEPFNEITVTDLEGNELCTAIVQSDKTWGCTPVTPLEDGDHTIIATEKDPTGNVSDPSNEVTFTITPPVIKDLDPPNPPVITGPEDGETVTTDTPEITGAGDEPGNTITVTDEDGNEVCTAIVTENKTWACTPENPFEDGPHTLTATETDDEGNESDPSDPIDFIVDTTPPKPPVITNPSDGDVTTNNTPTITGTGDEPGNTIIVTEPGGKQVCTAVVQPNKTWSCTPSKPMPDGDHTITATETDPAGNISDPSNEVSFTIDSTPPSDPTIGPSNGTELTGTTDPDTTITVRDEDGNEVEGCVDIKPDNKGTWICWPKEKLNEGDKVTVTAKDPAGNESNPVPGIITGLGIDIAFKQRNPLQTQIVTGRNFNPGETVCAFVYSEPMPLGCKVADAKGEATWTFTVPSGFAAGSHRVEIVGKISGKVSDTFMVTLVPRVETGGIAVQTGSGLAAVAMVLVAVGAATLIGVRRYLGNVN